MLYTNQKYSDPTEVLKYIMDDFAQPVGIGEQRDLGEFNLIFLERIEEGLAELTEDSQNRRDSLQ